MKKYNNDSLNFKDWTTKKLKEEAVSYDEMINRVQCYGTNDVHNSIGIAIELDRRGIEVGSKIVFN